MQWNKKYNFESYFNNFKRKNETSPNQNHKFKTPRLETPSIRPQNGNSTTSLEASRRQLPIFSARNRFLTEISKHESVILIGETGSGKTTQVPQFLHESRLDEGGIIGITQPRRVAAISIAKRVAQEMGIEVGTLVGYRVRFEDVSDPQKCKLLFQTDGMLLREAMIDPNLSKYSWIILDEAHERTVNTDILFGVVKSAQFRRRNQNRPLKVIVMSATMDPEKFSIYLRGAPILYVAGRQFPVNIRHVSKPQPDWQLATLTTIYQLHKEAPERNDILVFLTGQEEIESMCRSIRVMAKELESINNIKIVVLTLYAAQQTEFQQRVFVSTPPGARKVILSTNIAETSLTIPGIRYVIDSGRVKAKVHQASTGLDMLKVVKISKAQALQRTGRAGRQSEGHCYRILTKTEYEGLPNETVPEILRCNLANVLLQLLSMGISDVTKFDFLERPPVDAIEGALRQLTLLGAVDKEQKLTPLGGRLAKFPLDPRFAKIILTASDLGCSEEIITIVALLSGDNLLINTSNREEAINVRKRFVSSEGDHITLLRIFRAFKNDDKKKEFCKRHFVNFRNIQFAVEVRKQLMELCRKEEIKVQSSGSGDESSQLIRKALVSGLFMNVARFTREGIYVTLDTRQQVKIHPSSVLFGTKPELLIFTELISTQKSYIRDCSLVEAPWLQSEQPEYFRKHRITFGSSRD